VVSPILLGALLAQSQLGSAVYPTDPGERAKVWEASLNRLFKGQPATVLFDVDLRRQPPILPESGPKIQLHGTTMIVVAAFNYRSWKEVGGVQLFRRRTKAEGPYKTPLEELNNWLKSLDAATLSQIGGDGIPFATLPTGVQQMALRQIGAVAPDALPTVIERLNQGAFRLKMRYGFQYKDANGNTETRAVDSNEIYPDERARQKIVKEAGAATLSPLSPASRGPMKFESGVVLTFAELVSKASGAFGKRFDYDQRLGEWKLFVYGEFSYEDFLDAIREASEVIPFVDLGDTSYVGQFKIDDLLAGPLAGLLESDNRTEKGGSLGPRDFQARRTVSFGEVLSGMAKTPRGLASLNLQDSTPVQLWCGLTMVADFGGTRTSPFFRANSGDDPTNIGRLPNLFAIGLSR